MDHWLAGFDLAGERYQDRLREAEQLNRLLTAQWKVKLPLVFKVLLLLFL